MSSPLVDLLLSSGQSLHRRVLQDGGHALIHSYLGDTRPHKPRPQDRQGPAQSQTHILQQPIPREKNITAADASAFGALLSLTSLLSLVYRNYSSYRSPDPGTDQSDRAIPTSSPACRSSAEKEQTGVYPA